MLRLQYVHKGHWEGDCSHLHVNNPRKDLLGAGPVTLPCQELFTLAESLESTGSDGKGHLSARTVPSKDQIF